MNEPDDFGLDAVATLAHVGDVTPSRWHSAFWRAWRKMLDGCEASLDRLPSPEPGGPTHVVLSAGGVRIFCVVLEPVAQPGAVLVTSHGYEGPGALSEAAGAWRPLVERGVRVVQVAIRGFAPSDIDTGPMRDPDTGGWISRGLPPAPDTAEELLDWSYALGAIDLACVARAARAGGLPLFLHGESFGGGLATAVAGSGAVPVARLVLGVPTMGDWPWRLRQPPAGGGLAGEVARYLIANSRHEEAVAESLRVMDSVVLARSVGCPTLCKLALRDDVVPAPSSAAIYNALGTPASSCGRFVVPYGHFDGGIASDRRHALFRRMAIEFLDPSREPTEVIDQWRSVLTSGTRGPVPGSSAGDDS